MSAVPLPPLSLSSLVRVQYRAQAEGGGRADVVFVPLSLLPSVSNVIVMRGQAVVSIVLFLFPWIWHYKRTFWTWSKEVLYVSVYIFLLNRYEYLYSLRERPGPFGVCRHQAGCSFFITFYLSEAKLTHESVYIKTHVRNRRRWVHICQENY